MQSQKANFQLADIDRQSLFHPATSIADHLQHGPLIASTARGIWVNDQNGRNLMDFGAAVRSLVPAEKRTASEKMLVSFEDCIAKTPRPSSQLVAIVEKYVKDNPGQWHARMSGLVFEALRCKDAPAAPAAKKGE